jgi:hypothetical protein
MNTTLRNILASLACIASIHAQQPTPQPAQPAAARYTLADGDSTVIIPKDWMIGKKDEKYLVAWISSDKGKGHTHRIYRLAKSDIKGGSAQAHVSSFFDVLTKGDPISYDSGWKTGESHGGVAHRRSVQLMSDVSGDDAKENVFLFVEVKEFADRVYLQVVYHVAPLEVEMIKRIDGVLNSVQPKKQGDAEGAANASERR